MLRCYLLYGIANMDHDVVTAAQGFMLQQKQINIAFDACGMAAALMTVDRNELHRYAQAHHAIHYVGYTADMLTL